ncbi:hypothetical protein B23_3348 [Geobacillus thermoleovorans B23]|nr:hypothetical protein B23_3348 [Geobacillus thermoleovorans B23]
MVRLSFFVNFIHYYEQMFIIMNKITKICSS